MSANLDRLAYMVRSMSWLADPRWHLPQPELPIDRPIFLLGTQGGGLTLLSRMLRRHPDVISATGNSQYWTGADELQNVYGLAVPFDLTGLRYKAPFDADLPAPRSWTYAVGDLLPKYRRRAADATPRVGAALKHVIRYCARRYSTNPSRCRFLDKSQTATVRVGMIHEILLKSEPRFVLVPRDPYVSVLRAAEGKAGDMRRMSDRKSLSERIQICAEHYGNSMRAVREDCDELKIDIHLIQFERLVSEPVASLKEVCRFVGLDYRSDMLPAADHRFPLGSRFHDRWYPVRANVNECYARRLDASTVEAVNAHCRDIVEWLGYAHRDPACLKSRPAA